MLGFIKKLFHFESEHMTRNQVKQYLRDLKVKTGCKYCGYKKYFGALSFDHRDPKKKKFDLSNCHKHREWKEIKAEIKKCDVVCLNCHAELEYMRRMDDQGSPVSVTDAQQSSKLLE